MQLFELYASFRSIDKCSSVRKVPICTLFAWCLAACSGTPTVFCEMGASGNQSATVACGNIGGMPHTGGATSAGGQSGVGSGGTSSPSGDSLIANGSFELDFQSAATVATAPPNGWAMVSSSSAGTLLHAVQSDGANGVPPAAVGLNVARFDSVISSGYREARSACFPIDPTKPITARYQVRIPSGQLPAGTKASVKLWYYQDASCSLASAVRASDTQTATSNVSAGVWEPRQFTPAQNPPGDSLAASLSIRGAYVVGPSCGSAGTNCQNDVIFYDDVVANQ